MNNNGYEFSVSEIRVQLIMLRFPLPPQKCPDHAWVRRQVLGDNGSADSGQECDVRRNPRIPGKREGMVILGQRMAFDKHGEGEERHLRQMRLEVMGGEARTMAVWNENFALGRPSLLQCSSRGNAPQGREDRGQWLEQGQGFQSRITPSQRGHLGQGNTP